MPSKDEIISGFRKFVVFCATNTLSVKFYERIYESVLWNHIKEGKIPNHIGIILDGNRRWAQSRGLRSGIGHSEGAKKVEDLMDWCREVGKIKTITLYVFSTENFQRSQEEVGEIMLLLGEYFRALLTDKRIHNNKIRIKIMGDRRMLPPTIEEYVTELEEKTKDYKEYFVNMAVAYGGRAEILDAVKKIAVDIEEGKLSSNELNEETIKNHLYTSFLPNPYPDLIIRTSGEERLSNFLIWQSAYSELCFLDVYWPAFRKIDLMRAIRVYQQRKRRWGA
ncbi:MAG: polyprenyl diphosphate synthase [Candidatus Bathyarchaeota archaeon]